MAHKIDHFALPKIKDSEVTVRAGIDSTGVSLKAKSRAITAILAGKIASPETFSVATLRLVTELDRKSAVVFQEICLYRIGERHILENDDDVKGERMYDLYNLEEHGLLKEVGGNIHYIMEKQEDGYYCFTVGSRFIRALIEPMNEFIPVSNVIQVMLLSNAGFQLAKLLPHDDYGAARA